MMMKRLSISITILAALLALGGCVRDSGTENRPPQPPPPPVEKSPETPAPLPQQGTPQLSAPSQADANQPTRSAPVAPLTLIAAAAAGDAVAVTSFLNTGADVNMRNEKGETALMAAAANGHRSVVEVLLAQGANKRLKDPSGRDAATIAREKGHSELASFIEGFVRHQAVRKKQP